MRGNRFLRVMGILSGLMGLAGCTSTASRSLVVAVSDYDARSREAIDAVEAIERAALEQVEPPEAVRDAEFVAGMLDPRLSLDGPNATALVARRVHPYRITLADGAGDMLALKEMRCSHARFTAAFGKVETAGVFGKKTIAARAPEFLDLLVAQQIALARTVMTPAYAQLTSRRTLLIQQMIAVRAGKQDNDGKGQAMLALRAAWLAVEADEDALTANAVTQLAKAAATGAALRNQILAYGKWSLSDLSDSAKGLAAFIGSVRGSDMLATEGRIDEIRMKIEGDPMLSPGARLLLARIDVPRLPAPAGDGGPPARAPIPQQSLTPCLDGLRRPAGEAVEAGAAHGG